MTGYILGFSQHLVSHLWHSVRIGDGVQGEQNRDRHFLVPSQLTGRGRRQGSKNVADTFLLLTGVPTYLIDIRMDLTPLPSPPPPSLEYAKKAAHAQLVSRDIPKFLMSDAAQSERFLGLPNQSFSGYQVVG